MRKVHTRVHSHRHKHPCTHAHSYTHLCTSTLVHTAIFTLLHAHTSHKFTHMLVLTYSHWCASSQFHIPTYALTHTLTHARTLCAHKHTLMYSYELTVHFRIHIHNTPTLSMCTLTHTLKMHPHSYVCPHIHSHPPPYAHTHVHTLTHDQRVSLAKFRVSALGPGVLARAWVRGIPHTSPHAGCTPSPKSHVPAPRRPLMRCSRKHSRAGKGGRRLLPLPFAARLAVLILQSSPRKAPLPAIWGLAGL